MKVLGIYDKADGGGAAVAANRLLLGLEKLGASVSRLVWSQPAEPCPLETQCAASDAIPSRVERRLARLLPRSAASYLRTRCLVRRFASRLEKVRPDIISLHNIHGSGWPLEIVEVCAAMCPTVWTLHDMWSFTGRCAYSHDCNKYLGRCDETCPTPSEYPALPPAEIGTAYDSKAKLLRTAVHLSAATPSRWLASVARTGLWKGRRVDAIPNGIDLTLFPELDKVEVRRKLGIPLDQQVILTVAQNLSERRKGGAILPPVMHSLRPKQKIRWILVGDQPPQGNYAFGELDRLGFVSDPIKLRELYRVADVLVHPAPSDNLPNVVVEAMAMGLPVVAFPVGGLPELVRPGVTGWLCENVSADSMLATLQAGLSTLQDGASLSASCRRFVQEEFTVEVQARRYLDLFQEVRGGLNTR